MAWSTFSAQALSPALHLHMAFLKPSILAIAFWTKSARLVSTFASGYSILTISACELAVSQTYVLNPSSSASRRRGLSPRRRRSSVPSHESCRSTSLSLQLPSTRKPSLGFRPSYSSRDAVNQRWRSPARSSHDAGGELDSSGELGLDDGPDLQAETTRRESSTTRIRRGYAWNRPAFNGAKAPVEASALGPLARLDGDPAR